MCQDQVSTPYKHDKLNASLLVRIDFTFPIAGFFTHWCYGTWVTVLYHKFKTKHKRINPDISIKMLSSLFLTGVENVLFAGAENVGIEGENV